MMKKMTQMTQRSARSAAPAYGDVPRPVVEELSDADLSVVCGGRKKTQSERAHKTCRGDLSNE